MSNVLMHHGILGMKWGVRRTPAQLGHDTGAKGSNEKGEANAAQNDASKKSGKKPYHYALSDDELSRRISRLNMEEQYENLIARQKERNTSVLKKKAVGALESFTQKGFDFVVNWAVKKVFSEKDPEAALKKEIESLSLEEKRDDLYSKRASRKKPIDIEKWRDADVRTMDYDTALQVSKWYSMAKTITKSRAVVNGASDDDDD